MSKQFTAKVFRWLHQVNADTKLAASCTKVAVRLSPDFNEGRGGMAWSACKTMADDIGKSEGTVINAIRALHARGHLRVKWGKQGRGHSNQYWMLERQPDLFDDEDEKPASAPVFEDEKPQPAEVFESQKTSISEPGKPQSTKRKPQFSKRKPQPVEETLTRPTDQPSRGTHRVKKNQPPNQVGKKRASGKRKQEKRGAADADADQAFARFWSVYPRHDAKERGRKAFAAAVKGGVDPEVIIARARVYAITERARIERERHPEYTAYAASWLRDRRWEDPLPDGVIIDQDSNVVAVEQPSSQHSGGGDRLSEILEAEMAELAKINPWWAS